MKDSDVLALVRRFCLLALMGTLFAATRALCVTDPTIEITMTQTRKALVLQWGSLTSVPYQVESSSNLVSWVSVDPVRIGTGGDLFSTNAITSVQQRYFRVRRAFPAAAGSAVFDPVTRVLTVVGDAQHTTLTIAPDANGIFQVNSGAIPIKGGIASNSITVLVQVLGTIGDDVISVNSGLIPAHIFGDRGNDTLGGSSGNDLIVGGPGADVATGGRGNDAVFLEDGDDIANWSPGDGSDTIEGGLGADSLQFNGANISEIVALSANGTAVRLTRNIAAITLDLRGIENINLQILGGADSITVGNLFNTGVTAVNVDLASSFGGALGDAQADTVIVEGGAGGGVVRVSADGTAMVVTKSFMKVRVTNGELASDRISIVGEPSDSVSVDGTSGPDAMQVSPSPIAGSVRVISSGYAMPVDVASAAKVTVSGLAGPDSITGSSGLASLGIPLVFDGGPGDDTITGGDGDETLIGGDNNDTLSGLRGNDTLLMGSGDDTAVWNPGDGNDIIEGQGGFNALTFNGANIAEDLVFNASGTRLQLLRNIANIRLDLNSIQVVNLQALGGADNITVNALAATGLSQLNIDLASTAGGASGDGQADKITLNGTAGVDAFSVSAALKVVKVTGVGPQVSIRGAEKAIDSLILNGLGGVDTFLIGPGVSTEITVTPVQ